MEPAALDTDEATVYVVPTEFRLTVTSSYSDRTCKTNNRLKRLFVGVRSSLANSLHFLFFFFFFLIFTRSFVAGLGAFGSIHYG